MLPSDLAPAIVRFGPSFELISNGTGMSLAEVKRTIENTPALATMFKTKIAQIALLIGSMEGNLTEIAEEMNLPRYVVEYIITSTPSLTHLKRDQQEMLVDSAESQLRKAVGAGKRWAVEMTLRGPGRQRGWGEVKKVELEEIDGWQEIMEQALQYAQATTISIDTDSR
jgi:hypothetical protein